MTSGEPSEAVWRATRERWAAQPEAPLTGHTDWVKAVAWGQLDDRPVLATGDRVGTVKLWDPETRQELASLTGHQGPAGTVAWGQLDGRPVLATGSDDGTVKLWDPKTRQELGTLTGHTEPVQAVAWGQLDDRPVLATGSSDGTVKLWDPKTRQELATLTGHRGPVGTVAWGQLDDRPVLATGGDDDAAKLWDPETREELASLTGGHFGPVAVAWGQLDGRPVLATASSDGTVKLWDPETREELATLAGHRGPVWAVAWGQLASQPLLATGGDDGMVKLWDPETREELATLTGHRGPVWAVAWGQLANRPVLASSSSDNTVRLWAPMIERFPDLPGYRSDDPTDPDRLGRDPEATALAELITARSARPPLAIGLFGDWGEGKSHFLGRIADHVQRLAAQAPPDDVLTHSAVRQIRFNAWHYAETDLWASLVTELFSQLATGPGDPGVEERRQSRLAAELAARRQLPARLRAAQERKQALQQELDKQTAIDKKLPWRLDPQQQAQLAGVAGDQPEQVYLSMRSTASGLDSTARFVQRFLGAAVRRPWFWLGLLLVAAAAFVALMAPGPTARVVSTVAGVAALLGTVLSTVRSSLNEVKDQAAPVVKFVQQHAENRRRRLESALEVATTQVNALETELRELTPTGQLTALVERRGRQDSPYRAHVGLMTQVREDFEQMAQLLAAPPGQQPTPGEDEVGDELPHIDRIVIYIDDLDRCPPARVVEVLGAVHLLLAVPLFVVVVAVDPRWLLGSLTVYYRKLLRASSTGSTGDDLWASTPIQYLEKIFQIPFTLPAVNHIGYTSLIDALTVPTSADHSGPNGDVDSVAPVAATPQPATAGPTLTRLLPAAPVVERIDPLALTDHERRLLTLLGPPLVATPRSVKRLVNSYGLLNALRGDRHLEDLKETPHGTGSSYFPYRSAMALLAILIAFPSLSPTLFTHLHRAGSSPDSGTWTEFLKQVEPQPTNNGWRSGLLGSMTEADARRWIQLTDALQQLTVHAATEKLPLPEPLDVWVKWVVPVGRLSFETGRVVVAL